MERFIVSTKRPTKPVLEDVKESPLQTEDLSKAVEWFNAMKNAGVPYGDLSIFVERDTPELSQFLYIELFIDQGIRVPKVKKALDEAYGFDVSTKEIWLPVRKEEIQKIREDTLLLALKNYKPGVNTGARTYFLGRTKKEKKDE